MGSKHKTQGAARFERHGLSDEQLVAMMRTMLMQRTLENRGFQLNRQGKIPFASASEGHEAVQAGAALAFARGKDVYVPYYRDLGLDLGIGLTPYEVLLSLFARKDDHSAGRQFPHHYASKRLGLYSISSIIATQIPHAVGAAYAMKYRNEDRAVLVTFGDGSTSEGEWHESLNFAAVHRLPIVFLCENNQWAISTPLAKQMGQPDVAMRAAGYGMPGAIVDGMDPVACYVAVKEALVRARSGGGPSLVEAKCYRFLSHTTDDDDR
ncbi:MAG: thiamine pyrophosphate-dependent dehydrogenase E1 component subunit alpha, partial [Vulcanimicrobiaceae bacterium]